ncbi:nuclear control of ATPase protein 2 [Monosporozyma unispora]|nr:Nuclear control of ATPase protein 2 [Kazachstania unispora]
MIYDHFIAQQIDEVNEQLVNTLEKIDWPVTIDGKPRSSQLTILQNHLNDIKHIIDGLNTHVKDDTAHDVVKIDYKRVDLTTTELTQIIPQSPLEEEIIAILNKYITILCYYTLFNKLLTNLPQGYDDQLYYKTIMSSNWNKIIYFIQTSVIKSAHLLKLFPQFKQKPVQIINDIWKPQMMKLFMVQNIQLIGIPNEVKKLNPFKVVKFVLWQQPLHMVNHDLTHIIKTNSTELHEQTKKLGYLITLANNGTLDLSLFNQFISITSNEIDINDNTIKEISEFDNKSGIIPYKKLGFLTRYWPILFTSIVCGPRLIRLGWDSRFNLKTFIQKNIIDLSKDLLYNWVWLPFKRVLATIRHDESDMIAMVSKDTVQSEQDSLIRMIIKVLLDNGALNPVDDTTQDEMINSIIEQIEMGQMGQFMNIYEKQLSKPIKNTVNGKLIRSILIQIQKMKVDGSIAMNGIDKMLKSQELLFGMIALSPSFLLLYSLGQMLHRLVKWGNIWSRGKMLKLKFHQSLNNIERLLNLNYIETSTEDAYFNLGLLVMEISTLYELGYHILPKKLRQQWKTDILELLNNEFTNDMKLNVISRIHHFYGRKL